MNSVWWRRSVVGLVVGAGCGDDGRQTSASGAGQTGDVSTGVTTVPTSGPTTGMTAGTTESMTGGTAGDSQSTGGMTDPTAGTTADPTATTGPATATEATVGASTGVDLCEGTLCGQPVVCCDPGEECVEQKCLPECPSGIRCGPDLSICCDMGDVCSGDSCVSPGKDCNDSYDCEPGEYCEPTLDKCLPQPDPVTCEVVPDFDTLAVNLEWSFTTEQVISSPAIADLTGDGIPEVIVNTTKYMVNDYTQGIVLALDGAKGTELWRITPDNAMKKFGSHGRTTLAVGDVSGDKIPDVIYAGRPDGNGRSQIHAVDHTGKWLWTARNPNNTPVVMSISNGAATMANFDDDEMAEVVWGASLIDNDGLLVWSTGLAAGHVGSPVNYPGGISAVADLDADGKNEIITGKQAWNVTWTPGNPPTVMVAQRWINNDGNMSDGWPAIADLDANGTPEIVLAANGQIRVLDGPSGKLWCGVDPTGVACQMNDTLRTKAYTLPGGGFGGPPTIADFDGAQPQEPRQGSSLPPRCRNRSENWRALKPRRTTADSGGTPRSWRNAGGAKNALGGPEQAAQRVLEHPVVRIAGATPEHPQATYRISTETT